MNTNLVSLKSIISNIKMHPMLVDVPEDYIIVKTRELIQIVGVPILFKEAEADIETENFRAVLPCDYYDMIQVVDAVSHIPYIYSTATFKPEFYKEGRVYGNRKNTIPIPIAPRTNITGKPPVTPTTNTDNMPDLESEDDEINTNTNHTHKHRRRSYVTTTVFVPTIGNNRNNTYKVQGRIIYTALESTKIHIAYRALYLDDEGYPMLIDNASFLRALESYIKMNWFTIQYDMGRISKDVKDNATTDYYGNIKQAETQLTTPTIDQMESLSNIFTSLLEKPWGHENTFKDVNREYQLRLH